MTSKRCADCIHLAPWPERVEFAEKHFKEAPAGYPLWACMQSPTKALAVAPGDGTSCTYFERGDRDSYVKEVCDDRA